MTFCYTTIHHHHHHENELCYRHAECLALGTFLRYPICQGIAPPWGTTFSGNVGEEKYDDDDDDVRAEREADTTWVGKKGGKGRERERERGIMLAMAQRMERERGTWVYRVLLSLISLLHCTGSCFTCMDLFRVLFGSLSLLLFSSLLFRYFFLALFFFFAMISLLGMDQAFG
ncbi:hypothetical protein M440DRAFT_1174465 [Trichoderma longibrachiatum ATCC 18648]|uniref:Uncharacterized protein n=1 Tax=Trichoderma longibrachiatum ATCC 18648 TaxID=983965 RepID=A0A2T4CDH9_TRILO|nr:hypothetical protein M440DRAFT_1174465 [Trichoderma longibrachiatum ATCC 18648]